MSDVDQVSMSEMMSLCLILIISWKINISFSFIVLIDSSRKIKCNMILKLKIEQIQNLTNPPFSQCFTSS